MRAFQKDINPLLLFLNWIQVLRVVIYKIQSIKWRINIYVIVKSIYINYRSIDGAIYI